MRCKNIRTTLYDIFCLKDFIQCFKQKILQYKCCKTIQLTNVFVEILLKYTPQKMMQSHIKTTFIKAK